jgi:hypothetical protein
MPPKRTTTPKPILASSEVPPVPKTKRVAKSEPAEKKTKKRAEKTIIPQQIYTAPPLQSTNIVLNLKCTMEELKEYNNNLNSFIHNPLEYNSVAPPEVQHYEGSQIFAIYNPEQQQYTQESNDEPNALNDDSNEMVSVKDMSAKIKQIKLQLYKNSIQSEKKSACFWCTYDYDNTPCYIPKYEMDGVIFGYGSFCRPECAVAYLMKENIDDSTKFDRYQLLNQIYSQVYECKKNIKPAPDPHYLLDKFYGNLSIQEYRKLLKTDHLLLVIDKPMTRILPELHEDTDNTFTQMYGIKANTTIATGMFKVKRQSEQPVGPSKASIVRNSFGLPV